MVVWLQSRRRISKRVDERRSTSWSPRGGGNARGHIFTMEGRGGGRGCAVESPMAAGTTMATFQACGAVGARRQLPKRGSGDPTEVTVGLPYSQVTRQ